MNSAKSEPAADPGRPDASARSADSAPRILFCCNIPLDPRMGSSKQFIELTQAFRLQGWEAAVVGPEAWAPGHRTWDSAESRSLLRDYLRREASRWDVVQYDYLTLPFPRSDFPPDTMMVAMSTLLVHNLEPAAIPPRPRWKSWIANLLYGRRRLRQLRDMVLRADETIGAADLTVVSTERDATLLAAHGHRRDRIVVVPLGITKARRPLYDVVSAEPPSRPPTIAFVGTFDPRKGMCDFPKLVERILRAIPEARFRLLGTAGLVPDAAEVLAHFPTRDRPRIEVVPRYEPDRLPAMLADCSVGVFPSLVEGFGYGVLEMLAAAIPVIAYDVAGPSAMLPPEWMVPSRDVCRGMAEEIRGRPALGPQSSPGRGPAGNWRVWDGRAVDFVWEDISRRMCDDYTRRRSHDFADGAKPATIGTQRMMHWHIVTGEYPPQPGGVADYTRLVARELARAGDEVQVWAPECAGPTPVDPGVTVTRLPGHFGRRARQELGAALDRSPRPFRLLVQYVPHMYGMHGMNVPFCLWLRSRRTDGPWVMFHEVAFPIVRGQKLTQRILARVQRWMAAIVARAAAKIWVSIPAWEPTLRELAPRIGPVAWLPVPSNMPTTASSHESAAVRTRLGIEPGDSLVGHFGTFGGNIASALAAILPIVLEKNGRAALLVGRGAGEFKASFDADHPELTRRIHAAADLDANAVADHLAACDVLLQPYADGVSSRRTSMMTGLALGIPTVTSDGPLTEPIWRLERLALLAPAADVAAHATLADRLLEDPVERRAIAERAARGYATRFSIDHAVGRLRSESAESQSSPESQPNPAPLSETPRTSFR